MRMHRTVKDGSRGGCAVEVDARGPLALHAHTLGPKLSEETMPAVSEIRRAIAASRVVGTSDRNAESFDTDDFLGCVAVYDGCGRWERAGIK
eukprot:1611380-Rhodomonas_salina.1